MDLNAKRQERAKLIADIRALLDRVEGEKRCLTTEESGEIRKMETACDAIDDLLAADQRTRAREAAQAGSQSGELPLPEPRAAAGAERATAFAAYLRSGQQNLTVTERRSLQADSDTAGGFIIAPQQFVNDLIMAVDNQVFVRQWATKYSVPNAQSLGAPSLDADPADPTWVSEVTIGNEDTTMTLGARELNPHPLAQFIKVTRKLLRMATINPEALVRDRLAHKLAVVEENAFLNGSGHNQPLGVFTANDQGIGTSRDVSTGNAVDNVTYDGLINAKFGLKQPYRIGTRAKWLFNRTGVKNIRKLKDGIGQYFWEPALKAGEPDRVLDIPVFESEYVPDTWSTGQYVGILGDWSYYWIADSLAVEIQRLDELYAAANKVGFISRIETDGMPVLAEAFVRVKLG